MVNKELNGNIVFAPQDKLVKFTLLWMFPHWVRPNHVTAVRFILSPLVFWLFWIQAYQSALFVFIIASISDAIDGSMARTRKQITAWGTLYDGVADKLLIGGVLLILTINNLSGLLAGMIIGIELLTVITAMVYKRKGIIHPANWWGKIKMNLQVMAIMSLLISIIWGVIVFTTVSEILFAVSIAFTIMSIIGHAKDELPEGIK